ncbi:MAG: hypothetical protein ACK5DJ_11865 [Bacteroidota bacterium]
MTSTVFATPSVTVTLRPILIGPILIGPIAIGPIAIGQAQGDAGAVTVSATFTATAN